MKFNRVLTGSLAILVFGLLARAQSVSSPELSAIVRDLGSDEYTQREAGQRELEKVPPSQVAALRTLASQSSSVEVKVRLEKRIAAMELHILLHPPGVSLHVTKATLEEIAAALAPQFGPAVFMDGSSASRGLREKPMTVPADAAQADKPTYTLDVDNVPFWHIIEQLNRQHSLSLGVESQLMAPAGYSAMFALNPLPEGLEPRDYKFVDPVAFGTELQRSRTGLLRLGVYFSFDPRIQVASCSAVRVSKAIDQEGADLVPTIRKSRSGDVDYSSLPHYARCPAVVFTNADSLRRIRELRGTIAVTVVEHMRTAIFDLTEQPPAAPLQTPRGPFVLQKDAAGTWSIDLTPTGTENWARFDPYVGVRVFDASGASISHYSTSRLPLRATLKGAKPPAKVEVYWPDKVRDYTIPIEIKEMQIPENLPVVVL